LAFLTWVKNLASDCSEPLGIFPAVKQTVPFEDIRREKRLLRQAIAASQGLHRIRLQRELAALEDYEREMRQTIFETPDLS
jgi:hypothetical protein